MAKDSLTVDISQPLRDAMALRPDQPVDYFLLLGIGRDVADEKIIDTAILERSKSLRKWQNSPAYSTEAVKLLTVLHRAGKIIKDPARRGVYRQELERAERGDKLDSREEFRILVRAAMADNNLDIVSRRELMEFAAKSGIGQPEAQQIVQQIRQEIKTQREIEAAKAVKSDNWEFRINEEGEEGFELMLDSLEASGEFTDDTPAMLMAQAGKYKVLPERAAKLIAEFQKSRFKKMVKRVAHGGAINDAQARLLLPKAAAYGLDQRQAYDIIADFSLSARSTDDALRMIASAQTFSADDINGIVENRPVARRAKGLFESLPPGLVKGAVAIVAVAALIAAGLWAKDNLMPSSGSGSGKAAVSTTPAATPAPTAAETAAALTPPAPGATPATTPATASTPEVPLEDKPDPPSGMLAFASERPDDPPAFEMGILEVTCVQFQDYLKATLDAQPAGFVQGSNLPVTGITWKQANAFCDWYALHQGWPAHSVTLPSRAEFMRALRGRTTRSNPLAPDFWQRTHLGKGPEAAVEEGKHNPFDKIFLGIGQMYDLLGNAAEWGRDAQDGKRIVLGGDVRQTAAGFSPLAPRWEAETVAKPTIGLRLVRMLEQKN